MEAVDENISDVLAAAGLDGELEVHLAGRAGVLGVPFDSRVGIAAVEVVVEDFVAVLEDVVFAEGLSFEGAEARAEIRLFQRFRAINGESADEPLGTFHDGYLDVEVAGDGHCVVSQLGGNLHVAKPVRPIKSHNRFQVAVE